MIIWMQPFWGDAKYTIRRRVVPLFKVWIVMILVNYKFNPRFVCAPFWFQNVLKAFLFYLCSLTCLWAQLKNSSHSNPKALTFSFLLGELNKYALGLHFVATSKIVIFFLTSIPFEKLRVHVIYNDFKIIQFGQGWSFKCYFGHLNNSRNPKFQFNTLCWEFYKCFHCISTCLSFGCVRM